MELTMPEQQVQYCTARAIRTYLTILHRTYDFYCTFCPWIESAKQPGVSYSEQSGERAMRMPRIEMGYISIG